MGFFDKLKDTATTLLKPKSTPKVAPIPLSQNTLNKQSNNWFSKVIANTLGKNKSGENKKYSENVIMPIVGGMYFYQYDPKTKEKLLYYDTLPLIICIGHWAKGWVGINLHYAPPPMRKDVIDELMKIANKTNSINSYQAITFDMFQNILGTTAANNMIKKYIASGSYVKSKIVEVDPTEWYNTINLPHNAFERREFDKVTKKYTTKKVSHSRVWADTRSGVMKRKKKKVK